MKRFVDKQLTAIFRQAAYEADDAEGRTVYKASETPHFAGLVKEMEALLKNHKDDQEYLTKGFSIAMDRFFEKLGVPPNDLAAFGAKFPEWAAWMNRITANVTFSWVVGGAPIQPLSQNTVEIPTCHFREQLGEEGCQKLCLRPVTEYFGKRMNMPMAVVPQPIEQGLGCRVAYGSTCLPKELEW